MSYITQANIKRIGVVGCGVPKVKACWDKYDSKNVSFSSLAIFLRINIHDSVEALLADR